MAYKYRINANENSCDRCDKQDSRVIDNPTELSFYTPPQEFLIKKDYQRQE